MGELRNMTADDLDAVVKIIGDHDEDDGEAAAAEFADEGFDNQFVIEVDNRVAGISGFRTVAGTDRTCWLSWVYLDSAHRGRGLGRSMLQQTLAEMSALQARKVFVKVSDYQDPEDGPIYDAARALYQKLGFESELVNTDFYDDGENQHILGLVLQSAVSADATFDEEPTEVASEKPVIRFNGLHEIAETDGAYTFRWTVQEKVKMFGKRSFTVSDLNIGLQSIAEAGGRKVFLTFPSNLPLIHQPLQAAGFKFVGRLEDYYERGVHELHFVHNLHA